MTAIKSAHLTRRERKAARQFWRDAVKVYRTEQDLLDEPTREGFERELASLRESLAARDPDGVGRGIDRLSDRIGAAVPVRRRSPVREWADIILVALVVAMGIRTFFIQPFKIPTGSMQPTLWGEFPPQYPHKRVDMGPPTFPLLRPFTFMLAGERLFGPSHAIHGDHVFVDKVSYNFAPPKRGDVIVFDTINIKGIDRKFYIKRLAGRPGEKIGVRNGMLVIDGEPVHDPVFERLYELGGYYNDPRSRFGDSLRQWQIPDDEYFALGDNSMISQDSRFWLGIPHENLVGRAFMVYWPFFRERKQLVYSNPLNFRDPPAAPPGGWDFWFGPIRPRTWLADTWGPLLDQTPSHHPADPLQ